MTENHIEPDGRGAIYRGDWVTCPNCGSADAHLKIWGEGVDSSFNCENDDCDERFIIR